ncbi:uncharacterized protein LOC132726005 [Ruditapes philippinarum]|uniref:uncharacterized protein LOC132726005 n=1 Tax=Ruditapes philippinarum TaxID=129788 RepID=UPI00295AC426|nr:uncharacterized protein LOC132726005 [Ruditapes philippinarum]
MRIKYRRTVIVFLGVQTLLICYHMLSSSKDSLPKRSLYSKSPDIFLPQTQSSEITKQVNQIHTLQTKQLMKEMHVTNGDCVNIMYPVELLNEESWRAVDEKKNAFVFSAYIVDQSGTIKVVGASTFRIAKIFCQYWFVMPANDTIIMHEKPANIHVLPESHGEKYSGAIFICPGIPTNTHYISLVTSQCKVPLHLLKVKNGIVPQKYQRKFTVCLRPLHFRYGRAYELVEWIEFNKMLGAEKIVVYNYSIAMNIDQVLSNYVEEDIVEVVQWDLPIKSYTWPKTSAPVEIHSMGTIPMLQDCLYRNRAHSEFLINCDVDEFIIPRSDNTYTWSELFTQIPSEYDTYIFRNTFFRKEWNSYITEFQNKHISQKFNIISLQYFEREDVIFPAWSRSKYFTRTIKEDKSLMIHEVSGSRSYIVPVELGLLHHYRNWQNYKDTSRRIVDKTVLIKYGEKLIHRVQKRWERLGNVKLDMPI